MPPVSVSAFGGKADMTRAAMSANDPKQTCSAAPSVHESLYRDDELSGRAYTHHATGMITNSRTA